MVLSEGFFTVVGVEFDQVKRMIGGIGNVLFLTYSQTLNGKDLR